jgi:hypothetical protein
VLRQIAPHRHGQHAKGDVQSQPGRDIADEPEGQLAFHAREYRRTRKGREKVADYPTPVFDQRLDRAGDLFSESVFDPRISSGFSAGRRLLSESFSSKRLPWMTG